MKKELFDKKIKELCGSPKKAIPKTYVGNLLDPDILIRNKVKPCPDCNKPVANRIIEIYPRALGTPKQKWCHKCDQCRVILYLGDKICLKKHQNT